VPGMAALSSVWAFSPSKFVCKMPFGVHKITRLDRHLILAVISFDNSDQEMETFIVPAYLSSL